MNLQTRVLGIDFQNPVLLAAGTCGFGAELVDVLDLEALGGFVTKGISREPIAGNPGDAEFGKIHGGFLERANVETTAELMEIRAARDQYDLIKKVLLGS